MLPKVKDHAYMWLAKESSTWNIQSCLGLPEFSGIPETLSFPETSSLTEASGLPEILCLPKIADSCRQIWQLVKLWTGLTAFTNCQQLPQLIQAVDKHFDNYDWLLTASTGFTSFLQKENPQQTSKFGQNFNFLLFGKNIIGYCDWVASKLINNRTWVLYELVQKGIKTQTSIK